MTDETVIDPKQIDSTTKQANIKMLDKTINVFVNEHGQATPIVVVARAKVDNIEYAALFDTKTKRAYAVEVIREHGQIKYFKDLDGPNQDEEWAVISNYFLKEKVYDENRISMWIWNTMRLHKMGIKAPALKLVRKA